MPNAGLPRSWTVRPIRALRKGLRLTNEQFATKVGVSVRTVIRWQTGEERPSPLAREKLDTIAREVT